MDTGKVAQTTDSAFDSEVLKNSSPVLVDFWAPWCGPCRMMSPVMEQIASEIGNQVAVKKMNVDENPLVASAMRIQGIPTLALFKEGRVKKLWVGAQPKATLMAEIKEVLGS